MRTFSPRELTLPALLAAKAATGTTVSVCIPARDEEATIGRVVEVVVRGLVDRHGLVDEVLVVDDGSGDGTARAAAAGGARVVAADDVLPAWGHGTGKGEALWKSVAASGGDLIAWCDADLEGFTTDFVIGLVGPLLLHHDLAMVKATYERHLDGRPGEGGRVTELVARPLVSHLFPALTGVDQPLGGEYAVRRAVVERVAFPQGYGVDLALLVDIAALCGPGAVAQVDLGVRRHRNRPLAELSAQAMAILQVALERAGVDRRSAWSSTLVRPGHPPLDLRPGSRPPLCEVAEYVAARRRHGLRPLGGGAARDGTADGIAG